MLQYSWLGDTNDILCKIFHATVITEVFVFGAYEGEYAGGRGETLNSSGLPEYTLHVIKYSGF